MTIKLKAVCAGEDMVLTVQGGYARRPVPGDGLIVETDCTEIFLPEAKVGEALAQLAQKRAASTARVAPRRADAQQSLPLARPAAKKATR